MSIYINYKFKIKSKEPQKLFNELYDIRNSKINFDQIKTMPQELLNNTSYDTWAYKTFGDSYNWNRVVAWIEMDKVIISVDGNKTSYELKPWFDKFKNNLEVYIYSEYDEVETTFENYEHIFLQNNDIVSLCRSDEIGLNINSILKINNKNELINYINKENITEKKYSREDLVDEVIVDLISTNPIFFKYLPSNYINNNLINKVLKKNKKLYQYLDNKMQEDRSIIKNTLKSKGHFNCDSILEDIHNIIKEKYKGDLELLKLLFKNSPNYFKMHIDEYKDNKEIALLALGVNDDSLGIFDLLSPRLKKDIDIVKKCCRYKPYNNYDKDFIKLYADNKEIALYATNFAKNYYIGDILENLSDTLKSNKEIVLKFVKKAGCALKYASEELRNDKKIVLEAIKQNDNAIEYAAEELRNNKEFVLKLVKLKGCMLCYVSEELQNDKEVVMASVKQDGDAIKYASEELRNDKEIVMTSVKQTGYAIEYASKELKNDKEVISAAVKQNGYALKYASKELRNDKEVVMAALKQAGSAMKHVSEGLKSDKIIVFEAIKQNYFALYYASEELKKDKEFVLKLIKQDYKVLQFANEKLKNDKEVISAAVKQNGSALHYASEELKNDKEFVLKFVNSSDIALLLVNERLRNNKKFMLKIVKQNGDALEYASEELKNDKEVVMAAVKQVGYAIEYASEELKNDKEFILELIREKGDEILRFVSPKIENKIRKIIKK